MSKSVYIAGKMKGVPYFNFPAFDWARDRLAGLGFDVFSPADMDRANGFDAFEYANSFDKNLSPEGPDWKLLPYFFNLDAAVKRDNEAIEAADAIYVIHEGFSESSGATKEVELGMSLGKIVVFDTMTDYQIKTALYGPAMAVPVAEDPSETERVSFARRENFTEEVRYTDPATGGMKGEKLARHDLLPPDIVHELAEHYGKGARKYADRNMEKGYPWSKSYAACHRHLNAFWRGEDNDAETGSLHLVAAAWHCFTMAWFLRHGKGTDDRPKGGTK